jgi:ligand-binding SRPBCC domain-containing protein
VARIELSLNVSAPRERCFDLARSVEAHTFSVSKTREHIIGGRRHGLLELGDEVTWRGRHFGVWQELTSCITAYERPHYFRDTMVRGAFARFDHDHFFDNEGHGTVMRDVFDFEAPLGWMGRFAEQVFLERYMERFLRARLQALKALAESTSWSKYVADAR